MAKYTIIMCDLCGSRIYRDGYFRSEEGAISIRARRLEWDFKGLDLGTIITHPQWKRRKYYICPRCVEKLKEVCKGGAKDAPL